MTSTRLIKQNKYINIGLKMEIIAKEIEVKVNKSQLTQIVVNALENDDRRMKLALGSAVDGIFSEQFPEYTNYSVSGIDEQGNLRVALKQVPKKDEDSTQDDVEPTNDIQELNND